MRYLELGAGLRALQSAEAAAYLDGIVSATGKQTPARDALQKAKEAAERLERVSEEILERHQDFGEVPPVLEPLNQAWLDCDEVFKAWARAEAARMAAAADGVTLASDPADVLYRQWEETRKRALAEQDRTLHRLRLSPGERAALLAAFSGYASR